MLRIFDFLFGNLEPFLILLRYDGSMLADLLRLAFEISATFIITFNRSPNNLPASKFVLSDTSGNGFRLLYSHSKRFSFISSWLIIESQPIALHKISILPICFEKIIKPFAYLFILVLLFSGILAPLLSRLTFDWSKSALIAISEFSAPTNSINLEIF